MQLGALVGRALRACDERVDEQFFALLLRVVQRLEAWARRERQWDRHRDAQGHQVSHRVRAAESVPLHLGEAVRLLQGGRLARDPPVEFIHLLQLATRARDHLVDPPVEAEQHVLLGAPLEVVVPKELVHHAAIGLPRSPPYSRR